jgi:exosortase
MQEVAPFVQEFSASVKPSHARWQTIALIGLVGGLYWAILEHLTEQWWRDPNFSHGFVVPVFSVFVLWESRHRFEGLTATPSWAGLAIVMFAIILLLAGVLGSELFLARVSLLVMIAGLVIFFLGWTYFRRMLFPWGFLFFMIPIPAIVFNEITLPLQLLASRIAACVLPLAGVPVLREGNVINLPSIPLEVAEACSGIRSLISLSALAVMYGYFREKDTIKRVILAAAAVPIAILANSFRIVGTGLLVEYWSPSKAEGFFHALSGVVMFVFSLAALVIFHRVLSLVGHRETK